MFRSPRCAQPWPPPRGLCGVAIMCTAWPAKQTSPAWASKAPLEPGACGRRDVGRCQVLGCASASAQVVGSGTVGPAGDHLGRVARHVADEQRLRRAPAQQRGEPPAMIAGDVCASSSSIAAPLVSSALLTACLSSSVGLGRQARAAPDRRRNRAQHQVVGGEAAALGRQCAARLRRPAASGNQVRGLDDLDATRACLVRRRHVVMRVTTSPDNGASGRP